MLNGKLIDLCNGSLDVVYDELRFKEKKFFHLLCDGMLSILECMVFY